jgi:hypothetical protein
MPLDRTDGDHWTMPRKKATRLTFPSIGIYRGVGALRSRVLSPYACATERIRPHTSTRCHGRR